MLHVEALKHDSVLRLARIAEDVVAAYSRSDLEALARLNAGLGGGDQSLARVRELVENRVRQLPDGERRLASLRPADVQLLLARQEPIEHRLG